uniref:Uncharacterized protein n=1 Tax=Glossina brevipalpis TaxID=37001 RepID=A0A1A9WLB8_9MUSC
MKFAKLENLLGDTERCGGICELAIQQPRLDMPELLWKAYIDFERTQYIKVWIPYAKFELSMENPKTKDKERMITLRQTNLI